ncbi:aldehyde dehydrogenase [Macrophomina phaseolina]|uniref:aldehyde dehydrogenase (NAD(+)) n=1 Tax=Macrophomina phaseolina TaxID=35725 RepID=A0ABQ8GJC0_9PEZI|nr:aldehyde dehydrogenase [Macrophomina phaseolina]
MTPNTLPPLKTQLFINNEYIDAKSKEVFSVYNPADESLVTDAVQVAGPEDVDAAVDGALKAFKSGPWRNYTAAQRAECMLKLADLIEEHAAELQKLETVAMGVPEALGPFVIKGAIDAWRYYAGWAGKIPGQTFPSENGGPFKIVTYEPLGVCAGISPWNGSHQMLAWKIAPAVAAGNTVIFKSSEKSPLGTAAMGELIKKAGFPPGVIQLLAGAGPTGALLARHMQIAKVSFTGSVGTGKKIHEMAIASNMKRCTLELGGKSPAIIFNDADIDNAVNFCTSGVVTNSGQVCIASSRILVQREIASKFIEALTASFRNMSGTIGPLADRGQYERVMSFIEAGKKEAELAAGGRRLGDKGYFVEPTLFVNPGLDASIYQQEIFGPVGTVRTFDTEEEAIQLANDTLFGLSATLYTASISRALRVASALESGTVGVNTFFYPDNQIPFGGWKESGMGRECGLEGIMAYVQSKSIHINMKL